MVPPTALETLPADVRDVPPASDARAGRRRRHASAGRILYPCSAVIALLLAWEAWVKLGHIQSYLLPPPTHVVSEMFTQFVPLLPDTWATLEEILLGFGLSVVVGIALAMIIVTSDRFEQTVYPILVISQVVPKIAVAPLMIVWLGFGLSGKVLIVFTIAFFPIVIDTITGLRSVEIEKLYLAQSMGASRFQTFVHIRLPGALPSIFTGVKLSATFAVIGAVVGEFVASDHGLGHIILAASSTFNTPLLFTGVAYLTVIGLVMFFAVDIAERIALPWHSSRRLDTMLRTA